MKEYLEDIENLIKDFKSFERKVVNYEEYSYLTSTFHSTSIEGSTLTELEVIRLILDGKTAHKKPFEHHLMVRDYYDALMRVIELSKEMKGLSIELIQEISSLILKNTGSIHSSMSGDFDSSKGEFRKLNVFAGTRRFPDHSKVVKMVQELIGEINDKLGKNLALKDKLELSFYIHFQLVSIHPFVDGNGRLSRLMMNYIQNYFGLPISNVFKDDRLHYIDTLEESREKDDLTIFYKFMFNQYKKFLKTEIKHLNG